MSGRNRSAACGAWREMDGTNGHQYCLGSVNLPAPLDTCTCPCHGPEHADNEPMETP